MATTTTTKYTDAYIFDMKTSIEKFGRKEHLYIATILKKNNVPMNETSTNMFVDMKKIPIDVLIQIDDFLTLCFKDMEIKKNLDDVFKRIT